MRKLRRETLFFCVRSTGIYCVPGCAARPKPENVVFLPTRSAAKRAGFRPCKRCRPDRQRGKSAA